MLQILILMHDAYWQLGLFIVLSTTVTRHIHCKGHIRKTGDFHIWCWMIGNNHCLCWFSFDNLVFIRTCSFVSIATFSDIFTHISHISGAICICYQINHVMTCYLCLLRIIQFDVNRIGMIYPYYYIPSYLCTSKYIFNFFLAIWLHFSKNIY